MAMTEKGKSYSVLAMNTLAFTVNFAIWTMFSIIGIRIKSSPLTETGGTNFGASRLKRPRASNPVYDMARPLSNGRFQG